MKKIVQWYGKTWEDFTDDDKRSLYLHLKKLKAERGERPLKEYCLYLSNHCNAPKGMHKKI